MISQRVMLDIIATEAIEGVAESRLEEGITHRYEHHQRVNDESPTMPYDLQLVKHPDGRYEWID